MKDLDSAWRWYTDAKKSLRRIERFGHRYWHVIPWNEPPWRSDNHFYDVSREDVTGPAQNGLEHLDDLAVVVLFSVFEAVVRQTILAEIETERSQCRHRAVVDAIKKAQDRIDEGSFFAVLNPYKSVNHDLIEQVHQVRRYRNWVSHGKRGAEPASLPVAVISGGLWQPAAGIPALQRYRRGTIARAAPPQSRAGARGVLQWCAMSRGDSARAGIACCAL